MSLLVAGLLMVGGLTPVEMTEKTIGPPTPISGGTVKSIEVDGLKATLFVPQGWKRTFPARLWCHFHSADWYVVSQYQEAEISDPVLVCNFGQGSAVYAKPFEKPGSLSKWLRQVESEIGKIERLSFTSFSAGFGAVRKLVQDPLVLPRLDHVVLSDSFYGSLDTVSPRGKTLGEHIQAWQGLTERAIAGKATWVITTSQITPETYAGTWEVARDLVDSLGGTWKNHASPPKDAESQPLLKSYEQGGLHVWCYAGETPVAHMTHARHMVDILRQIRKASKEN